MRNEAGTIMISFKAQLIVFLIFLVVAFFMLNYNRIKIQKRNTYLSGGDLEVMFNQRNRLVFALLQESEAKLGENDEKWQELSKLRVSARSSLDFSKRIAKENLLKQKIWEFFDYCFANPELENVKEIRRLSAAMKKWDRDVLKTKDDFNKEAQKYNEVLKKMGPRIVSGLAKAKPIELYDYKDVKDMTEQEMQDMLKAYEQAEKEAKANEIRNREEVAKAEKELEELKKIKEEKRQQSLFDKNLDDMSIEEMEELLEAYAEKEAAEAAVEQKENV